MANLHTALATFDRRVTESERVVSGVEALWQTAPLRSDIRRRVGSDQMAALYEMAYLSLFGYWENFIEECLERMLVGQGSASYQPTLITPPRSQTLAAAHVRVLNGRSFQLWHDPGRAADRIASHISASPLETTLRSRQSELEGYSAVRHAIAHRSTDAKSKFEAATSSLCGVQFGSPGEFLRSQDHSDSLNPVRWIRKISAALRSTAAQSVS